MHGGRGTVSLNLSGHHTQIQRPEFPTFDYPHAASWCAKHGVYPVRLLWMRSKQPCFCSHTLHVFLNLAFWIHSHLSREDVASNILIYRSQYLLKLGYPSLSIHGHASKPYV
jgi:hypothetical protein